MRHSSLLWSLVTGLGLLGCRPSEADTDTGVTAVQDSDGDTILDLHERLAGKEDPDGDGLPNWLDTDSDGDGLGDALEAGDTDSATFPIDSDGDEIPDFLDLDSDDNLVADAEEHGLAGELRDTDGDGVGDPWDPDNDGDGLLDVIEAPAGELLDSDRDFAPDYVDVDSDGDGIGDRWEARRSDWGDIPVDTDGDGAPDYLDDNADDDVFPDSQESGISSVLDEPRDTDGDGAPDFQDVDSDGDGISDTDEVEVHGTDPLVRDTDGDGFSDGVEVAVGSSPLDAKVVPPGLVVTVPSRHTREEQYSFSLGIERADFAFVVDAGSNPENAWILEGASLAMLDFMEHVVAELPEPAFSVSAGHSYGTSPWSHDPLPPFELALGTTTDTALVTEAMEGLELAGRLPSGLEAMHQVLTGAGYDLGCDGTYDPTTDVLPWVASASDPFGGTAGGSRDPSLVGVGDRGGVGFRAYTLPVVVFASRSLQVDPTAEEAPNLWYFYEGPGGCPMDAGFAEVVEDFAALGAVFVGLDIGGTAQEWFLPEQQMLDLAYATGSLADVDGDGSTDPLAFEINWAIEDVSPISEALTLAVDSLLDQIEHNNLRAVVEDDAYGFVIESWPEVIEDATEQGEVEFTFQFMGAVPATEDDQVFTFQLGVVNGDDVLLDRQDITVIVPGTTAAR